MSKTPSALKWLAEKRARLAHDHQLTGRLASELAERHQWLQDRIAALDDTIRLYDEDIDPTAIAPIAAQGRYGQRGVIRKTMLKHLSDASPEWMSTTVLEARLVIDFSLVFPSAADRTRWRRNTLCAALRKLCKAGVLQRLHDPEDCGGEVGYWRIAQAATPSLADL